MTALLEEKDIYLAHFSRFEKELRKTAPDWLNHLRQSAIDRFAAVGFPTVDDEEWRATNLAALTRISFELGNGAAGVEWVAGNRPAGVILCSLAEAIQNHPNLIEPYLGQFADIDESTFTALNTAFLQDGVFLHVPRNAVIETPIEIRFRTPPAGSPQAVHRRVLVLADPCSQARIIERYDGVSGPYFTSAVSEIILGDGAMIEHCKVQQEGPDAFHIHTIAVRQGRASKFTSNNIAVGGKLARTEINVFLGGEGCKCTLNGLYLGQGEQLIDSHTRIEHAQPHCTSHELYKGILDGKAHGVFSGKIHVHPRAQKTDARQTNQTLLLSDDATINSKPQLEIYADDVKCTHGATVGQLDAEALFYLRSRGLPRDEARSLLAFAFANEIIERIEIDALRSELEKLLHPGEQGV